MNEISKDFKRFQKISRKEERKKGRKEERKKGRKLPYLGQASTGNHIHTTSVGPHLTTIEFNHDIESFTGDQIGVRVQQIKHEGLQLTIHLQCQQEKAQNEHSR